MPLGRSRIRTIMIAVAVTGAALGWLMEAPRRRTRFEQLAKQHQRAMALAVCTQLWLHVRDGRWQGPSPRAANLVKFRHYQVVAHHDGALARKYAWAARHPWLPVPPDPPPPE